MAKKNKGKKQRSSKEVNNLAKATVVHSEDGAAVQDQAPPVAKHKAFIYKYGDYLLVVGLALLCGMFNFWKIFEYDLFWHLRAGEEIFMQKMVQKADTWSYTVQDGMWINFQWLYTLGLYLLYKIAGSYDALIVLRSILVALWVASLGVIIRQVVMPPARFVYAIILIPAAYIIASFRFQMRPDLVSNLFFALLIILWQGKTSELRKNCLSVLLLVLWTNFHSGTVPIGIFTAVGFTLFQNKSDLVKKIFWVGVFSCSWFVNPHGIKVMQIIFENVIAYDFSLTKNPDLQPLSWRLFELRNGGWHVLLWAIFSAVTVGVTVWQFGRRKTWQLPDTHTWLLIFFTGGGLLYLNFGKIRSIPYGVVFWLPVLIIMVEELRKIIPRKALLIGVVSITLFIWLVPFYQHITYHNKDLGWGLATAKLPVLSTEFIKSHEPQKNLWNSYEFGGYLIKNLPAYPVSIDGRDTPYTKIKKAVSQSGEPKKFASLLKAYNVNVVMESLPATTASPTGELIDTHEAIYPRSDWALVFFDNVAVVYLRRIAAHEKIIAQYEYHQLRRGLPANFASHTPNLNSLIRLVWEREIDRCLTQVPNNTYCLNAKASFLQKGNNFLGAEKLLLKSLDENRQNPETLLFLEQLYRQLAKPDLADEYAFLFKKMSTPLN